MKKIALIFAGVMVSSMASAVQLTSSGNVTMVDCNLLNENVRINLSTGVFAGVSCNNVSIALSACHSGGKQTTRSVPVRDVAAIPGPPAIPAHIETCVITPGDTTCALRDVTGPAMPAATTLLGTVNTQYPGGACTAAAAEANSTVMLPR